jgi:hypothetical protein
MYTARPEMGCMPDRYHTEINGIHKPFAALLQKPWPSYLPYLPAGPAHANQGNNLAGRVSSLDGLPPGTC